MHAFWHILGHAKPDPSSHRVAPKMRSAEVEVIEDRNSITHLQGQRIQSRVMRFIACSMSTRIQKNELVIGLQRVNIASHIPALHTLSKSMMKYKWWTFTCDLIMNADSLIIRIWHTLLPATSCCSGPSLPLSQKRMAEPNEPRVSCAHRACA